MSDMVSEHFKRREFSCKCGCGFDAVDVDLLDALEDLRHHFGKPVKITNACRCLKHNKEIGSEDTSQHVRGKAADIKISGVKTEDVALAAEVMMQGYGGIGRYDTFTHIDVRQKPARWDNRIKKA